MIRSAGFQKPMARMALVAMLLLAFSPVVTRVLAGLPSSAVTGWAEICTATGLKFVDLAKFTQGDLPEPARTPMAADCAYCPLLAATALLLVAVAIWLPRGVVSLFAAMWAKPETSSFHPCGLGSRGPPVFL